MSWRALGRLARRIERDGGRTWRQLSSRVHVDGFQRSKPSGSAMCVPSNGLAYSTTCRGADCFGAIISGSYAKTSFATGHSAGQPLASQTDMGIICQRFYSSSAEGHVDVVVPFMGDSVPDGVIASILKKPGDYCDVDEVIAQIETDKVTIDIRSPEAGVVEQIVVKQGDTVTPKTKVAVLKKGGEKPAQKEAPPIAKAPVKGDKAAAAAATKPPIKAPQAPSQPSAPSLLSGLTEPQLLPKRGERRVQMTRLRQRVASRLKDAQNTYAMLTTFNEIDMTNLVALRNDYKDAFLEQHGVKLGFMSAFVKASADALQRLPTVNAVIDGESIVYRDHIDISIAVATSKGLVVPVLRNVSSMGFADIEKNIAMLGEKAKDGSISIDDMAGGTFTISNGGVYGSLLSTPIINPPQSAILGMHAIQKRPVAIDDQVVIRPMMYVSVTYDHRLVDGREAVLFLRRIKDIVEDPHRLLLDC